MPCSSLRGALLFTCWNAVRGLLSDLNAPEIWGPHCMLQLMGTTTAGFVVLRTTLSQLLRLPELPISGVPFYGATRFV
jgi:hypothetical protein